MLIADQRAAFAAIGLALQEIAIAEPLDWKAARRLQIALGEALQTEAQKQKRARYLAKRAARKKPGLSDAVDPSAADPGTPSTRA